VSKKSNPSAESFTNHNPPTNYTTNKTENHVTTETKLTEFPQEKQKKPNHGLLADCSFEQLKYKLFGDLQCLRKILPKTVDFENIKGLKLAKQNFEGFNGIPKNLMILNISGCYLKTLNGLENCMNLKILNAENNSLTEIPIFNSVTELYLSKNHLKQFPDSIVLKILDISHNLITEMDKDHINLPALTVLKITDTPFSASTQFEATNFEQIFPKLNALNPKNIFVYSSYKVIASFIGDLTNNTNPIKPANLYPKKIDIEQKPPKTEIIKSHKPAFSQTFNNFNTKNTAETGNFSENAKNERSPQENKSHKKQMSNVIESVVNKRHCVVNVSTIKESMRRGARFDNPIAAMMIGPGKIQINKRPKSRNSDKLMASSSKLSFRQIRRGVSHSFCDPKCRTVKTEESEKINNLAKINETCKKQNKTVSNFNRKKSKENPIVVIKNPISANEMKIVKMRKNSIQNRYSSNNGRINIGL